LRSAGLTCLFGLALLSAACKGGGPASPEAEDNAPAEDQVRQAVEAFYAEYLGQTELDVESGTLQNPLVEDYGYREDARLDAALVTQIDGLVEKAGERGLSADPFLCATQIPERVDVDTVALEGDTATATVYTRYADSAIPFRMTVGLVQGDDGAWKLSQIQCK